MTDEGQGSENTADTSRSESAGAYCLVGPTCLVLTHLIIERDLYPVRIADVKLRD